MTDSKTFGRKNRITSYTAYNYRVRKKANTVGFSFSYCKEERVWRGPEYFAPVKRYISINSPNNDCPVSRRLRMSSYITLSVPGHYITNNDNCGLGGLPAGLSRTGGWWTWIRSITKTPVMLSEGPKTRFLCFKASIHQARRPPLYPSCSFVHNSPSHFFPLLIHSMLTGMIINGDISIHSPTLQMAEF